MSGCVAWKLHTERGGLYGGYLDQSEIHLTHPAEICGVFLLLNSESNECVAVVDVICLDAAQAAVLRANPRTFYQQFSPFYFL